MKSFIYIIVLIMLTSCSSYRQVKQNIDKKADINKEMDIGKISNFDSVYFSSMSRWDSIWSNAIINFRVYDTSRPDSLGNCPVLIEAEMEFSNGKISQEYSEGTSTESIKDSLIIHTDTKIHEELKEKTITKTKKSICQPYQWWILGILALLNGALIIYLKQKTKNIQEE